MIADEKTRGKTAENAFFAKSMRNGVKMADFVYQWLDRLKSAANVQKSTIIPVYTTLNYTKFPFCIIEE